MKIQKISNIKEWNIAHDFIQNTFFKKYYYNPYLNNALGIFQKDKIIGSFTLKVKKNIAFCDYFNIKKSKRSKGLGKKAIKKIEKYLKKNKVNKIIFFCSKDLFSYYKDLGYKDKKINTKVYKMYKKI